MPTVALPPAVPFTYQVTAVLSVPVTVAVNCTGVPTGVNVSVGHDDLANMFYPFGDMNPLFAANVAAHVGHLTSPEQIRAAFEMPGYHAAKTFGIREYGIQVGLPANLLLLPVESEVDALRLHPAPTVVMRDGRILVRTRVDRSYDSAVPA